MAGDGQVTLGDNVVVGANTVVTRDVASRTAVYPPEMFVQPLPDRLVVAPTLAEERK